MRRLVTSGSSRQQRFLTSQLLALSKKSHGRLIVSSSQPHPYARRSSSSAPPPLVVAAMGSGVNAHKVSFFSTKTSSAVIVDQDEEGAAVYPDHFYDRVELDSSLPLSSSVDRLLQIPVGRVHHLDFYNKFPNIMRLCCKHGKLQEARLLLERMLQEKQESCRLVPAKVFETLLFGYANLAKKEPKRTVKQMMEILALMEREHDYDYKHALEDRRDLRTAEEDSCQPTTHTYNTVLGGLASAATFLPSAARHAETLLEEMEDKHQEQKWHTKPNTRSYTHVITAFGNVGNRESGDLAEAVLQKMKLVHKLEAQAYETKYKEPYNDSKHAKRIITPDEQAYTAVILAHSKSTANDSADKAFAVLNQMIQQQAQDDVRPPDAFAIITCIHAFADKASMSSGNVKSRVPAQERAEAAAQAEALLQLMEDFHLAATQHNDAASDCSNEQVSEQGDDNVMDESSADDSSDIQSTTTMSLKPSVIAYNSCLNAWAGSDTREAAPRADALLQQMIKTSMNDPEAVKPNLRSFNTVLNAWARYSRYDSEAPEKAEELLDLMYELYYSGRLEDAKPNAVTYTCVINAWARSGPREDKVQNARRLLETMLGKYEADEEDMKPNIMAYTSVLNSAAHSPPSSSLTMGDEKEDDPFSISTPNDSVFSIVVKTYDELKNDPYSIGLAPDHAVFATMLQAIRQHTADTSGERRQMVELVFDDACAAGEVSASVIRAVRDACPSIDLLERLLRSQKLARKLEDVSQLPQQWTRNVDYSPRMRIVDGRERHRKRGGQHARKNKNRRRKVAKDEKQK